jgi:hypothetical protein
MLNRMSLFVAMLATVLGLTTPAFATVVYTRDAGVWHMTGDVEPDASDNACILQTSSATAHVQINIFPKTGIPDHVTMTVADPKGTWRSRQTIEVKTLFLGDNVDVTPFFLTANANNNEKIIFRDLPSNFLSNFGHAKSIILFREGPKEIFIDLTGTSELLKSLEDCKMSLVDPVAQPAPSPDVAAVKPDETPQPGKANDSRLSGEPSAPSNQEEPSTESAVDPDVLDKVSQYQRQEHKRLYQSYQRFLKPLGCRSLTDKENWVDKEWTHNETFDEALFDAKMKKDCDLD